MRLKKTQKGLTLIEVVVALLVLTIIIPAFAFAVSVSLKIINEHSQNPEKWLRSVRCCAESILSSPSGINEVTCNDVSGVSLDTLCADCVDVSVDGSRVPNDTDKDYEYCRVEIEDAGRSITLRVTP